MSTYALDIPGQTGDYPVRDTLESALHAAYDELRIRGDIAHVTVLSVETLDDGEIEIEPLCSVVPPITPPSTSPEVPNVH